LSVFCQRGVGDRASGDGIVASNGKTNFLLAKPRLPQLVHGQLRFVAAVKYSDQRSFACTGHDILPRAIAHKSKKPTWRSALGHRTTSAYSSTGLPP